jgi:branched-chain amino acid transport system ATP-binding protein
MSAPLLRVESLVKHFGALCATDHVSFDLMPGEIHALIGPNGAGKTSFVAQVSGHLQSDSGRIVFADYDLTRMAVHERVMRGLARSFQITRLFKSFTVIDNIALSVQARSGTSLSFWRPVAAEAALVEEARSLLARLGLAERADSLASELSHGEQRVLEIGLALSTRPRVLLLDEPMAGVGPDESRRLVSLIDSLRSECAILLVEHDMEAVFQLADRITVLVNGAVIASGPPSEIRNHPQVIAAYLGDELDFATHEAPAEDSVQPALPGATSSGLGAAEGGHG